MLPLPTKPIVAWLIGFISLIGIQLGYNIVIGIASIVIVNSNGELFTDVAFLFFLAVFAPALAVAISSGGGIALYQSINQNAKATINITADAAKKLALLI